MHRLDAFLLEPGDEAMIEDYTILHNTVNSFDDPDYLALPVEYFQSSFLSTNISFHEDFLLVRNNAGELIASGAIFSEGNITPTSRLVIQVHPKYRQQQIGSFLLNHLIQRGQKKGSSEFVCRVPSYRPYAVSFLEKHGFSLEYTWLKMHVDLNDPIETIPLPFGLTVRAMNIKKELTVWAQLQNSIFNNYPDYVPVNFDTLSSIVKHCTFNPSFLIVGMYFTKPVGYCLGFSVESMTKEKTLKIEGIGILPEFRRRGYGSALVTEILNRAHLKGHASSELVVRNSNTAAISLYEKIGFRQKHSHFWYRRTTPRYTEGGTTNDR